FRSTNMSIKLTAVYQGVEGAHSDLVIKSYFQSLGIDLETKGVPTFREVATQVLSEKAEVGVLPVDNAISGTVREGYDLLAEYDLEPFAEMVWRMDHRVLGVAGAQLSDVREVLAHPMVLNECRKFLGSLFGAKITPWPDTGLAAQEVAQRNDKSIVAIAPPEAAKIYGQIGRAHV